MLCEVGVVGEGDYGIKEMGCVCVGCYAVYRSV